MTNDEQALLAAVIAAPDNDLPRLIYADWLEEHGQPERAEFIRVQVELATIPVLPQISLEIVEKLSASYEIAKQTFALRKREEELLDVAAVKDWSAIPAAWDVTDWWWVRGFIEKVCCPTAAWLEHGDALCAAQPIRKVTLTTWPTYEQTRIGDFYREWDKWGQPMSSHNWPGITFELPSELVPDNIVPLGIHRGRLYLRGQPRPDLT